ncbi:hypothetical protein AK88_01198 [Plasmodium fragile]|uniref:Uncharacterized protein n=1 Tax=Plasmodium fragile TaxID=5857 RepID=A0A0D9QQR9_PLAFR|nr:uncharacterized protein AK88_01198 [Plasmodium fragile]KJP89112.1 hypothetical protein AK88_01198 [Plasmodium fragile]
MEDIKGESIRSEPPMGDEPTKTNNDKKKKKKKKKKVEKCTNKITNFFSVVKSTKVAKRFQTPNPSNCENNRHADEHPSGIHTIINKKCVAKNSQVKENMHQTCDQNVLPTHVDAGGGGGGGQEEDGTNQMLYPPIKENTFYASPRIENELTNKMNCVNVKTAAKICGITNVKSILRRDVSRVPTLGATLRRKDEGDVKNDGEEKPRCENSPEWRPPHGEPQDEGNKTKRGLKRKKDESVDECDTDDVSSSLDMSETEEDGVDAVPEQDQLKGPRVDFSSKSPTQGNNVENVHLEPNRRDYKEENMCSSSSPPEECAKVVKTRKFSLVNFFGNDIEITVNVNEDSASEGRFSSADSDGSGSNLGCTGRSKLRRDATSDAKRRNGEDTPKGGVGEDEMDTLRTRTPSYKRNSISDGERYSKNNEAIYAKKKKKRERYSPDRDDAEGKGGQASDELSQNEHANSPLTQGRRNFVKENKRVLKSDNEFELERAKTKRVRIGRVSCAGVGAHTSIGMDIDAQADADEKGGGRNYSSNRAGRKTCLNVGFVSGFCRKTRKSCAAGVGGGDAGGEGAIGSDNDDGEEDGEDGDDEDGEDDPTMHPDGAWDEHAKKAQNRNRKDGALGRRNHFETNVYQMKNNVQEKLTSIKNNFRLNDNVRDILNEKRRIKILRVLNKYYFEREYKDYVEVHQGAREGPQRSVPQKGSRAKCSTANCSFAKGATPRELLRDHSSKPFTFFIAGKFTLFSNFALAKKLKDAGYGITSNLRRSNSLIIGHDLSEDFVKKIENFKGRIFGEEDILDHLNVDVKKRIDLFAPINKNNAKRYKFLINQTNIDSAPTKYIQRKVLQFCRTIRKSLSESLETCHAKYKNVLLSNLTKQLSDFFLFLHLSRGKFHSNINSLLLWYRRKYHELMIPLRSGEDIYEFVLFVQNLCDVFSTCYIRDDLLTCDQGGKCHPSGGCISEGETRSEETPLDSQASTPQRRSGTLHTFMDPSQSSHSKEDSQERKKNDTNIEKKIHPPGIHHDEDGAESSLEYISPEDYFEHTDESGEMSNEEKELNNDNSAISFEKSITHNMRKSEKLKIVTNLWRVFFRPNSLYEIAGHKNEVLKLYKILRKLFPEVGVETTPFSNGRLTPKGRSKRKDPSDMHQEKSNIIFLVYPPNCGVKRLVELICYACDLCPIYESKVQKYKNINYFFKYTHGLKPISIYNANKLDKNSLNELSARNDVSICMYEDKNYVMNSLSSFSFPLLDSINHVLIKFGVPSRDALFFRCFSVCSCVIKNLNKELFSILFETCRLKDFSYSIESVYSKMHLVASYVNCVQRRSGEDGLCVSDQEPGARTAEEAPFNFPNDVLHEYISNHLMNRFFMNNYDEVERALSGELDGKLENEATYWRSNGPTVCHSPGHTSRENSGTREKKAKMMKRLNEDYYFFRGFDVEDIRSLVHDWYDKMHIQNEKLIFDLTIKKNSSLLHERSDYLYMDDGARRDRERILIKVLELFLYASILVKSDDVNINLIAVDMAVYWRKYLFMSPPFRLAYRGSGSGSGGGGGRDGGEGTRGGGKNLATRQKKEELVALQTRANNNDFINETKVKDHMKGKMDKCNKIFCEKVKKYRSLMAHFGCPFNFSSAGVVYDFLQNSKVANLAPRRRGDAKS